MKKPKKKKLVVVKGWAVIDKTNKYPPEIYERFEDAFYVKCANPDESQVVKAELRYKI